MTELEAKRCSFPLLRWLLVSKIMMFDAELCVSSKLESKQQVLFLLLTLCSDVVFISRHGLHLTGDFLQSLSHLHLESISSSCQKLKKLELKIENVLQTYCKSD